MTLHYSEYLRLDRLLSCQEPRSGGGERPAHDELLFIVVHQAYELWFKQILFELDALRALFAEESVGGRELNPAVAHLRRVVEIQRVLLQQVRVLETMTPLDFLDFRDELFPASGMQSVQFRLVENALGLRPPKRLRIGGAAYTAPLNENERRRVEQSEDEESLFVLVERWLERTPFLDTGEFDFIAAYGRVVGEMFERERRYVLENELLSPEQREEQLEQHAAKLQSFQRVFGDPPPGGEADPRRKNGVRRLSTRALQAAVMINLYRDEPILQLPFRFLTLLMDVDEGFTEWRYRHAQMVARMIGTKLGTGGTTGNKYLKAAAERHGVFDDLFQLSTFLIPRSSIPPLPRQVRELLGFQYRD